MAEEKSYLEEQTIVLPNVEDGPAAIGDLWDCHRSQSVAMNLFGKKLKEDHLQANVLKELRYTLTHVRSTKDRHKYLQVTGEVSLDLMGGLIKVGGGAEYELDQNSHTYEEELLCNYDLKTFSVKALPSAKEVMDELVVEKIMKGEIKATHVVLTMVLGAEVVASIKLRESKSDSKEDIKGNFFGKLIVGPVSASAKVALGMLDKTEDFDFEKKIKVDSRPAVKSQPATVSEMFQIIESIDKIVEEDKYAPFIESKEATVYGVPVRYYLVPIKHFLDIPVEKLYLQIKDDVLEKIATVLVTTKDFQVYGMLKREALKGEPRLKQMLSDENNHLTKKIAKRESEMREEAKKGYSKTVELLKKYKIGKVTQEELLAVANEVSRDMNTTLMLAEVREFISEGRQELLGIRAADIKDSHQMKIFTNTMDMKEWYRTQKPIKVLLRTGGNSGGCGRVTSLYDIAGKLSTIGIEVGVAIPKISGDQCDISIKIEDTEMVYGEDKLHFVVEILMLLVEETDPTSTRLFTIYASQNGIKLPFKNHLADLHSMIKILDEVKSVKTVNSYLRLRDIVTKSDGRWKFVMNMNALDSVEESVKKYISINVDLLELPIDWIAGNFGIEGADKNSNSPLLFVFKDENLQAVCCDNFDILLLVSALKTDKMQLLEFLRPDFTNMKENFIHIPRAQFTMKVSQLFRRKLHCSEEELNFPENGSLISQSNKAILPLQLLMRSLNLKDEINLWNSMAILSVQELPEIKDVLKSQDWTEEKMFSSSSKYQQFVPQNLANALKEFFISHNPFLAKVNLVLEATENFQTVGRQNPEIVDTFLANLVGDVNCPQQLKDQLLSFQEIPGKPSQFDKVEKTLKKYLETVKNNKYESLMLFIRLLETPTENVADFSGSDILPALIRRLALDETKYPQYKNRICNAIDSQEFYSAMTLLSQVRYVENHLFVINNQLEAHKSLVDSKSVCNLLRKLKTEKISDYQREKLLKAPKVQHVLKMNANSQDVIQSIKIFHCGKSRIPNWVPEEFLVPLHRLIGEDGMMEMPDIIEDVDKALYIFQKIISSTTVPDNFAKVLIESLTSNSKLLDDFENANALFYWSDGVFTETWDCELILKAYTCLIEWKQSLENVPNSEEDNQQIKINLPIPSDPQDNSETKLNDPVLNQILKALLGNDVQTIGPKEFLRIHEVLPEPSLECPLGNGYISQLLPYIIQRVKMIGIHVIQPQNLAKIIPMITSTPTTNNIARKGQLTFGKGPKKLDSKNETRLTTPVSRIDILSCLNAICHKVVMEDILKILSRFPVTMPFILQDISNNNHQFACLLPLFKSASVKWETQPGVVNFNQLFINPFKMVVALRVGPVLPGKSGKSTILNQVMIDRHMFASVGDPGKNLGIPLTLKGFVEMAVLLPETCSSPLWKLLKDHYLTSSKNEVLMLANVHGDALELPDTIKFLKSIASSFILFFMPCAEEELESRHGKIQEMLDFTENTISVLVDPSEPNPETYNINTTQLTMDDILGVVRTVIDDAVKIGDVRNGKPDLGSKIHVYPDIKTKESETLMTYIGNLGCHKAKSTLQLQKLNPKYSANYASTLNRMWEKDVNLRQIITQFIQILHQPINDRMLSFAHLDTELSLLSSTESVHIRKKLEILQEKRRRAMTFVGQNGISPEQEQLLFQIGNTMNELDEMSLGMEHFYRELGRIYQAAQSSFNQATVDENILRLPNKYADLLLNGHAIELLDGDIGDICGPWLNSICHSVCQVHPDLRIFTLSIIGLQSSGKSTLLNALFACKFAVSVGRCTRGLFMRLIFLDEELVKKLGVDAILLIDTEGLGAPEKLNDPEAEHKDRLLATFAMSVSNLTLINVLGESLRDLTDILQIVIVTMARLEKADISPDILMVQHLSERDTSKTMKGADEFCKALDEAVSLTDDKDMAIGVRSSKSLVKLISRVKSGTLLKQFRPYKNGASANAPPSQEYHEDVLDLYQTILNSCKQMTKFQKFHKWHELIQDYWGAVSIQDFSLRFKNIKEVQEFIDRGNSIAKVKQSADSAFRVHRELLETQLRQKINEFGQSSDWDNWEVEKENELKRIAEELKSVPNSCPSVSCGGKCIEVLQLKERLLHELEGKNSQLETEQTVNMYIKKTRDSTVKHLNQMAEAIKMKHGWSCQFDAIIGSILTEKLRVKPNYSEMERKLMVDEIWLRVKQEVSAQLQVTPADRLIIQEVKIEYECISKVYRRIENCRSTNIRFPKLGKMEAIDFTLLKRGVNMGKDIVGWKRQHSILDFQQVTHLESELNEFPNLLLAEYKTERFEFGMVRKLKTKIASLLDNFEKIYGKVFKDFKWEVHIYALQKLIEIMTVKEDIWNKNNNPFFILCANEETYKNKIYIRLKHGFGFDAEGRIISESLLKAIRIRGENLGNRSHIDHIKSMSWLTNSENVRLRYFSKLAQGVQGGRKDKALAHFSNPKSSIESWFKTEVDAMPTEMAMDKYLETVNTEFKTVIQEIRNQENSEGFKNFISSYLAQTDDMGYIPGVDLDEGTSAELKILKDTILKEMELAKASLKEDLEIQKPSLHSELTDLLGCTEHCFWCGSLCWGQAGHSGNVDSTKKHHACHQPVGLIGTSDKNTRHLLATPCDQFGENWTVYWHKNPGGMLWSTAKLHEDFVNWTFTAHNKSEFNDLMKWFFVQLHNDISKSQGLLPALHDDLSKMGCLNLVSLEHILATIKSRV